MSQSLTPGPDGARRGPRAGLRVGSLGFVAMIVILIVAIIFAANQNDLIGWLVVAVAAGLACVAFPNENTSEHDFGAAVGRVDRLDADELQQFAGN